MFPKEHELPQQHLPYQFKRKPRPIGPGEWMISCITSRSLHAVLGKGIDCAVLYAGQLLMLRMVFPTLSACQGNFCPLGSVVYG
jgi:hypothetical protein